MADTITYDPSNDPQAIAEAEARDGETLAVGEQMQKDQSELLAGKYKWLKSKLCSNRSNLYLP